MMALRTLVDIGFFVAIMGWIVHPFVSDVIERQQAQKGQVVPAVQSSKPPEESSESTVRKTLESGEGQGRQFTLPTLTVDGSGRSIDGLVLDGERIRPSTLGTEVRRRGIRRLRLRGNPDIAHQVIMDIKHLCAEAGVESFEDVRFRQSSTLQHRPR
jgi:hypothetical protein